MLLLVKFNLVLWLKKWNIKQFKSDKETMFWHLLAKVTTHHGTNRTVVEL